MTWICAGEPDTTTTAMVLYSDNEEAVEWVNMCWRKVCLQEIVTSLVQI